MTKTMILGMMIVIDDKEPDDDLVSVPDITPDDLLARLLHEACKGRNPEQWRDARGPIFQV